MWHIRMAGGAYESRSESAQISGSSEKTLPAASLYLSKSCVDRTQISRTWAPTGGAWGRQRVEGIIWDLRLNLWDLFLTPVLAISRLERASHPSCWTGTELKCFNSPLCPGGVSPSFVSWMLWYLYFNILTNTDLLVWVDIFIICCTKYRVQTPSCITLTCNH